MIDSADGAAKADLKRAKRIRSPQQGDQIENVPPQSLEAETHLLSCIFINPKEVISEVTIIFGDIGAEVFYDLRHYTLFNTLVSMFEQMIPIDVVTVMERLKKNHMLEDIGGLAYLSQMPDLSPSAANAAYYAEIIYEKYLARKLLQVCTDTVGRVYSHVGDLEELFDDFERKALRIRGNNNSKSLLSMKAHVQKAILRIEDYAEHKQGCIGMSTGFADFDLMTSGLQAGEVFVLAARPSVGKTSLAMNIAEHVSMDLKLPVGVFSLETTADILTLRMVCSRARVNLRNIREGYLNERDYPKITAAAGKLANAQIWIDDESSLPIDRLRAKARKMYQEYGIKLFIIDYLQLCQAYIGKRRIDNRQQEIAEISGGIKRMAKELNVPVIALAQVDRSLDKENRKPMMADLRESAAIEQDADIIGFLYRPKADDRKDAPVDQDTIPMKLLIAKQKNGPTGEVDLVFLKQFTRYENAAKICDTDIPEEQETLGMG